MPIVTDASITVSWLLIDEADPRAEAAFERYEGETIVVPALWWFEARNALVMSERRGRIDQRQLDRALEMLARLPSVIDREPNSQDTVALARRHRLSIYDAAYLELAKRAGLPLASLDQSLLRACGAENVPLIG